MDVSLTAELERRIAEKVESGLYASASEVVRESLRRLFEADDERALRLDSEIRAGLDQLDRGEGIDGDESRRRVIARFTTI